MLHCVAMRLECYHDCSHFIDKMFCQSVSSCQGLGNCKFFWWTGSFFFWQVQNSSDIVKKSIIMTYVKEVATSFDEVATSYCSTSVTLNPLVAHKTSIKSYTTKKEWYELITLSNRSHLLTDHRTEVCSRLYSCTYFQRFGTLY